MRGARVPPLAITGDRDRWPDVLYSVGGLEPPSLRGLLTAAAIRDEDLARTIYVAKHSLCVDWAITPYFDDGTNQAAFANIWNAALDEQRRRNGAK